MIPAGKNLKTRDRPARALGASSPAPTIDACRRGCCVASFRSARIFGRATAYVCGLGFFDLYLNGQLVSDQLMNPALTGYDRRACYVTFDVTKDVHLGANAIGVVLGNGRYFAPRRRGPRSDQDLRISQAAPPDPPGICRRLGAERGQRQSLEADRPTDRSDPTTNTTARNTTPAAKCRAGRCPASTTPAGRPRPSSRHPGGTLEAQMIEPIRVCEVLKPVGLTNPKPGVFLVDFGQSYYGTVRLKVSGPSGTEVRLHTSFNRTPDGAAQRRQRPQRPQHGCLHSEGAGGRNLESSLQGKRYAICPGGRLPGHAQARQFRRPGHPHRHGAGRPVHLLQPLDQPDLSERALGHADAEPKRAHGTRPRRADALVGPPGQDLGERGIGLQRRPVLRPLPAQLPHPSGRRRQPPGDPAPLLDF